MMERGVEGAQQNVLFAVSDSAPTRGGGVRGGGRRRLPEAERRRTIRVEGGVESPSEREGREEGSGCFIRSLHNLNLASSSSPTLSLSLQICVSTPSLSIFRQQILEKIKTQPKEEKKKGSLGSSRSCESAGYGNWCDGVTFTFPG